MQRVWLGGRRGCRGSIICFGYTEAVSRLNPRGYRQQGLCRGVPGMLHSSRYAGVSTVTFTVEPPLAPSSLLGWEFANKQAAPHHFEQPYAVLTLE